ncbi:uncharacterized protein LOC129287282 [Prosopis cineraria]|uniref:uncharacterized protein LOC129287282 n=1 Tax=Prosopis cineraria TaxID=364024 RepID=UPI00240FC250|nr:uncharacterized protein LOC129287282 [Prosopis cineraria]
MEQHQITEKLLNIVNAYEGRVHEEMAKFGEYLSSKYGISPSTGILLLSVFIGCVCAYILLLVKRRRLVGISKERQRQILLSSKSLADLYSGDLACRRLNDYKKAMAIPDALDQSDLLLKGLLEVDEQQLDLKKIQMVVEKLEKAGKDEGLRILESAHVKHADKSYYFYEIEMTIVEMLIYKEINPEVALIAECLDYQEIQFDARVPFFKAIICGRLGNWEEAARHWDEFVDVRGDLASIVGEGIQAAPISDFQTFKERVQNLQNEISKTQH